MYLIVTNLEEVPDDLAPGVYCCRLESMAWDEMKVRFVPGSQHQPGDCLVQLTKEKPRPPQCSLDIVEGTDCPRPVVWRWYPYGRNGEPAYLCDEHAADKDLSDLWDLFDSASELTVTAPKEEHDAPVE